MRTRQARIPSLGAALRGIALALALATVLIAPIEAKKGTAPGDPDGDGLTNSEEHTWGGNPQLADTDNDGLTDGEEVYRTFTWPNDPDSDDDGLLDGFEVERGTLPYDADSDDDGYLDGVDRYPINSHRH
jgi:hypothetical protein